MAVSQDRHLEHLSRPETVERAHRSTAPESHVDVLGQLADTDLLHLISRGDLRALEVIYDRHIELAWRVALAFSNDVPVAEQAVEVAFLRLWRNPEPGARASLAGRLLSSVKRQARARSLDPGG